MYKIVDKITSGGISKQALVSSQNIQPDAGGLIECPNMNDVLSGRGGRINNHSGNLYYRTLVNNYKHNYLDKNTKKLDKVKIANQIVMLIRTTNPPGRFLKQDKDTKCWKEIGDEKARKKAGQAMRENAPETRRDLEEGKVTSLVIDSSLNAPASAYVSPLAISPSHVSYNHQELMPMPVVSHPGVIPTPIIPTPIIPTPVVSRPVAIPTLVVSHSEVIPSRVASYPPAGGYPQAGPIVYGVNSIPNAAARSKYSPYDQAPLPTPSGLQLEDTILQPLPYRPYAELGKNGQTTIPEERQENIGAKEDGNSTNKSNVLEIQQTPEERHNILGANSAAFDQTFNRLNDSNFSTRSDVSSLGARISLNSSKVSTGSSKSSPNLTSISIDISSDPDVEEAKREKFHQRTVTTADSTAVHLEKGPYNQDCTNVLADDTDVRREKYQQRIRAGTGHTEKDLNLTLDPEDFRDGRNSYLPNELIQRDNSETSLKMSDVTLFRPTDSMRMSINTSSFAAIHGRESSRDMSREMIDVQEVMADWNCNSRQTSSGSSDPNINRRERFKSDYSSDAMSFRVEKGKSDNSSSDDMSLVSRSSRRSVTSSWLHSFKGMQGLPPPGDQRQRLFSDFSNRSMLSELSTDMIALDLAADGSPFFNDPNSPPMSPPTSP